MITISLLLMVFILMIIEINNQETDHVLVQLDKKYNGTLESDNSYFFYTIKIPDDIKANTTDLVFRVKELDKADIGQADFSDPDIYVSKTNFYPKTLFDSEYFAERYGEDLLSIPSQDVEGGATFHFSIFCEFKCNYEFTATLQPEFKIVENEVYTFNIKPEKQVILKFDHNKADAREIEFISYSPKMSTFKMFVSTNASPSSQNTLPVIPSWIGGYYSSISRNSFNFCSNCSYYIMLEAEKGTAEVFFMVKYEDSINKVKSNEPIFSTLKPANMHCYSIEITEEFKKETLVIQTILFSGSASLLVSPWKNPRESNDATVRSGFFYNFKFESDILSENLKLITPSDRKEGGVETGTVYVCLRSFDYTSYLLKIYFVNQIEKHQKFNFLFTGVSLNGYLPQNTLTKYRAVEFTKDSDIYFDVQVNSGNVQVYGYVCEEAKKCIFNSQNFEAKRPSLIKSVKTPNGYRVTIPDKLNTCHRKLEKENSLENEIASLPCAVFSIVKCEGSEACSYNIITTHTNSITKLKERKPHYQIVPFNETDYYKITIDDESVSNVTIILNSNTGDADLFVTGINNKFDSRSINEGYIPDVIQIVKSQTLPNIKGDYLVNIKGTTFASYSLYYYTHKEFENLNDKNATNKNMTDSTGANRAQVINLESGKIIKGYIIEEKGKTNYKVYSYNPKLLPDSKALDIRITLTPEHSEYNMFVVFDVNNIVFENVQFNKHVKNFVWKSTHNNEIIISKSDQNYKKDREYYIIIIPKYSNFVNQSLIINNDSTDSNAQLHSFFFLGATLEDMPFAIQEGIPSSITLDTGYDSQNYWYYHYNISNPVLISLNVFYGRVDIYIDFFFSEDISKSKTAISALDTDTNFISISPEKIQKILSSNSDSASSEPSSSPLHNNNNSTIIPLYIMIKKSSFVDAQYLLAIKSHAAKPEKLQSSVVRKDILLSGESRNYFLHLRRNETGFFNIIFDSGYGDLYMNIFSSDDYFNANNYPNSTNFLVKASDYYRGKTLEISEQLLARCSASCKVLLSVKGNNLGYSDDKIEFSLSFYKEALKINQNQPYHNQINEGELQFFRVYFGENTQNVYISLTNMNGDADVYVNYGSNLPTFDKADWYSRTARNEFIEFNKEDNFFARNKLETISGEYTIMISGFKKTSYSLYISSHPKKILPLHDDSPASCITKEDAEYCYFRYDDVYDYDTIINDSYNKLNLDSDSDINNVNTNNNNNVAPMNLRPAKDLDIVILTHFIYGSGEIFAKLYDDTDYDILADFPDERNHDYSNANSNKRNFLYLSVKKDNLKYNTNSTILISVKCVNKCFFDLTATRQYDSTIKYLDDKKENIFYLYKSTSPLLFIYFCNKQGDLNFNLKAISGKAKITLYKNDTKPIATANSSGNETVQNIVLHEFSADAESKKIADIHGLIKFAKLTLFENVYFKITPESDFAFSLRITFKNDWQEIKAGKTETFQVDPIKKRFYGFLTMLSEYDNVLLSISANNKNLTAYCYVKYMAYDKAQLLNSTSENFLKNKIQTHIIPNEIDNDYKANNLNLYRLIALKLPKLDVNKLESKVVTMLFSVALFDHSPNKDIEDIKLSIRAAPRVNNITISSLPENSIEYVALEGFDSESSVHIYDLKRKSETEDILVLEVSACLGAVDVLVSKTIINSRADAHKNALMPYSVESANGRNIYTFKGFNVDNLYMVLNAKQVISQDCKLQFSENKMKCAQKHSEVLVKYFFTKTSSIYNKPKIIDEGITLEYEILNSKSVSLKWRPLMQIDLDDQAVQAYVNYEVYVSESINDFLYMDSICYLNLFGMQKNKPGVSVEYSNSEFKAKLSKIKPGKKYFVNILATNVESKDIYAYKSIEILTQEDPFPPVLIGGVAVGIFILIGLVIYFYRKYVYTKKVLNYEINDVRNVAVGNVSEMSDISVIASSRRYDNLSEDVSTSVSHV